MDAAPALSAAPVSVAAARDDLAPPARHFDICGPLPGPGVTVLEASAGTGKTYTIAALVTRMVAEGVASLSEILVVTFTRMATGELRERARQSLADAEAGLARALARAGGAAQPMVEAPAGSTPLLSALAGGPVEEVKARRQRLADALANFDAATITTTHGFCHTVLEALGVRGEVAAGAELLEDPGDLVGEVVDDLYVRHALRSGAAPFSRSVAFKAGWQAVANPGTPLDPPADRADNTVAGLRRRLAQAVRREVEGRLFEANLLTYDGLLVRLAEALEGPGRGAAACAKLRQRYRFVLVDEFQDTDSAQWDVVRRAFADGTTTLVLIGDPKQAVYAFRGADIYAYLAAARTAAPEDRFTLECNWRSDLDLLQAYNALFAPLQLGHPDIHYRTTQATAAHTRPGLRGAPDGAALRVRVVDRRAPWVQRTARGLVQKPSALKLIAADLADDVVDLLSCGAELVKWGPDGTELAARPLGPGDIGVLVRTNRQAAIAQQALRAAGVPAVVAGAESVLSTPAARHWLSLLEALEQPASRALAVPVALGPFIGMTAAEVATAGEEAWEELHDLLHRWSAEGRRQGVASLYATITASQSLPPRLLAQLDGERQLTDLGHIAELLHAQSTRDQLGLAALRAWLARRADETADGTEAQERSRRLDSGSDAVQLLTVHRAKGLEFPIVYCPYLWDGSHPDKLGGPVVFHDTDDGDRRKLDVGGDDDDAAYRRHFAAQQAELRGEELRHLYVALTRARHQAIIWWAGVQDCQHSALGRLLLRRDGTGAVAPNGQAGVPSEDQVRAALAKLVVEAGGRVEVEGAGPLRARRWAPSVAGEPGRDLAVATFARSLDYRWRRSSFTSLTAATHPASWPTTVGSEPEGKGTTDEPVLEPGAAGVGAGPGTAPPSLPAPLPATGPLPLEAGSNGSELLVSLLARVPSGAEMGTFVHRVLERTDFASRRLPLDLREAVEAEGLSYPGPPDTVDDLAGGLVAAIETPLGLLADGARLRDIGRRDRLDEVSFELPIAGGDSPRGQVTLAAISALWHQHVAAPASLSGYAERLEDPALVPDLRGYLTGSLDLVFRSKLSGLGPRYFVVDYKTNWLAPAGQQLTSWHYRPEALEAEMLRAHYPLQAAFYVVALHRYLRWRLAGYRPEDHLGGVLYLFLRGMAGAANPATDGGPHGIFSWQPPIDLVTGLSDLLAGRS